MRSRTLNEAMSDKPILACGADATAAEAAALMSEARSGSVLLLDDESGPMNVANLRGIFTERDLLRLVGSGADPAREPASDWGSASVWSLLGKANVADALLLMEEREFRHVPVRDDSDRIVGMFSIRDALPNEAERARELEALHEHLACHIR